MKTNKTKAAAGLDAILSAINSGSGSPGNLRIYTGSAPADLATSPTGTLLAQADIGTGNQPAFGSTSTTTLVAAGDTTAGYWARDASINATGTAGYWRVYDYTGAARLQGSVSTSGGGGELILNTLSLVAGGMLTITSFSASLGGIT